MQESIVITNIYDFIFARLALPGELASMADGTNDGKLLAKVRKNEARVDAELRAIMRATR
jgi:hypothetical protein